MAWTDERVELLKKLWGEGHSASQIAAELGDGVTRNAVIGKVHRLKLAGRAKPASSAPRPRKPRQPSGGSARRTSLPGNNGAMAKRRSMSSAPVVGATALQAMPDAEAGYMAAVEPVAEIYIAPSERLDLLGLNEQTCKWPIGDPMSEEFYFCGRHSEDGKPYCEFHSRRAYHTLERKRK